MNRQFLRPVSPIVRFGKQFTLEPLVRAATGLAPITDRHANDVFIVGYPKSGNTWFQNLVSGVVYGIYPQYTPDSVVRELVPDVHKKRFYRRFRTPMFFKSHLLPQSDYKRVVYLLRDGRDAMVSYYHYLTGWQRNEVDFMELVRTGKGLISKWHDHVEAWASNPFGAEILVVKYEDLKLDPVRELQRFCDYVGLDRDRSWLEQVAANTVFEKMQEKEKAGEYFDDSTGAENRLFFRRGIVGSYKDEMSPEILSVFLQDAQDTLVRCGYPVEDVTSTSAVK